MRRPTAWLVLLSLVAGSWFRAHLRNDASLLELPLHALLALGLGGFTQRLAGPLPALLAMSVGLMVLGDTPDMGVVSVMACLLWLQPLWPSKSVADPSRRLVGSLTLCLTLLLVILAEAPAAFFLVLAPLLDLGLQVPSQVRALGDAEGDIPSGRARRSLGCVWLLAMGTGGLLFFSSARDLSDVLGASQPLGVSILASLREVLMTSPPLLLGLAAALLFGPSPAQPLRLGGWIFAGILLGAPLRAWSTAPTDPLLVFLIPAAVLTARSLPVAFLGLSLVLGWEVFETPAAVAPRITGAADQPDRQALYRYDGRQESGPLLEKVSSAEVVHPTDWVVRFVREQGIWESHSVDGLNWQEPRPLGIEGFDPTWVQDPQGNPWLIVVETVDPKVDPVRAATRIVRYRPSGDGWERDQTLLAGTGLVDPALRFREDGSWELYVTTQPTRIQRALSPDGREFRWDPGFTLLDTSVAGLWKGWLVAQRHVKGTAMLFAFDPSPRPLGVCGTGPSVAEGMLYYSRVPGPCEGTPTGLPWLP